MKQVWKFPLVVDRAQVIEMPAGAKILCVQVQIEEPCIWALCDVLADKTPRRICILGTGHEAPDGVELTYIGTFQIHRGTLVFHVFEAQ